MKLTWTSGPSSGNQVRGAAPPTCEFQANLYRPIISFHQNTSFVVLITSWPCHPGPLPLFFPYLLLFFPLFPWIIIFKCLSHTPVSLSSPAHHLFLSIYVVQLDIWKTRFFLIHVTQKWPEFPIVPKPDNHHPGLQR